MTDKDLLRIEEVAEILRVSRDTVYRLAAKGEIPGNKIGRIWRFQRGAIESWASQRIGEERGRRQRAEAELAESLDRYHDLYENAPDMFATVEFPEKIILECNQTLAIQTGYRKEELLGRPVVALHAPAEADQAERWLEDLRQHGDGAETDLHLLRRDGELLEVSLRASVMRDADGNVIRGRLVWRDQHERKQVERALTQNQMSLERRIARSETELRETKRRLEAEQGRIRSLFDTVGVSIVLIGRDGRLIEWNPTAERVFGWKRSEVLGQHFVDRFIPAGDRPAFNTALERAAVSMPTHGIKTSIIEREEEDRTILWNIDPQPPDADGSPTAVLACGQDITEMVRSHKELEQSEQRILDIADAVNAVFWVSEWIPGSRTFEVCFVTRAFERIWGRQRESIYKNPTEWMDGIIPEDRARVEEDFFSLVEHQPFDSWYQIRRPDGTLRRIHDRGRGTYDEWGRLVQAVGLAEDVTDGPEDFVGSDDPDAGSPAA